MLLCGVLGGLHHTDHVLRFDHVGPSWTSLLLSLSFCLFILSLFWPSFCAGGGWGRWGLRRPDFRIFYLACDAASSIRAATSFGLET